MPAMLARRSLQHVCFMCAHFGRQFTTHPISRTAAAVHRVVDEQSSSRVAPADDPQVALTDASSTTADRPVEVSAAPKAKDARKRAKRVADAAADGDSSKPKVKKKSKKKTNNTPEDLPPPAPREPGPSETFLSALRETAQEPTLADLDRFKPRHQPKLSSTEYETAWNAAVEAICKSFSRDQLRSMAQEVAHNVPLPERKIDCARLVLDRSWGWKNPEDIAKEEKLRVEVQARTYLLTPSELFLLMGRGGADLLQLSVDHHVRFSVVPSPEALSVRVEGLRDDLNRVNASMKSLKQSIMVEEMDDPLPGGLPYDLVQRIARLSGVFLEHTSEGKLRMTAKREHDLASAKRLIVRAAAIDIREANIPTAFHSAQFDTLTTFPRRYALYPFMSPRTLLWTMGTGGAFRARKVNEWMAADDEFSEQHGLLHGTILTPANREMDLRASLLQIMPDLVTGRQRRITASVGNILFTSRTSTAQRASLSSPLEEPVVFTDLLRWVLNTSRHYKSTFVPDLPGALLSASPAAATPLNRLIYRAADTSFGYRSETYRTIALDLVIPELDVKSLEDQAMPEMDLGLGECRIGLETALDMLLPDRPMDIRFSVFDHALRALQEAPSELVEYAHALKTFFEDPSATQPSAPLYVVYGATQYTLDMSASVRRSVEQFEPPAGHDWGVGEPTRAVTESNIDLEGNQKATTCEIRCEDVNTTAGWRTFLHHCDRLTMRLPRPLVEDIDSQSPVPGPSQFVDTQ